VEIFTRDKEKKVITNFINDNLSKQRSALMYLCGHPGTGKTSTLNYVLTNFVGGNIKANLLNQLQVIMYNAMTFSDVKSFCIQLLEEQSAKLTGSPIASGSIKKRDHDDESIALMVAKMFSSKP
jgi:Cdc6-like AAA superfamily ATPase